MEVRIGLKNQHNSSIRDVNMEKGKVVEIRCRWNELFEKSMLHDKVGWGQHWVYSMFMLHWQTSLTATLHRGLYSFFFININIYFILYLDYSSSLSRLPTSKSQTGFSRKIQSTIISAIAYPRTQAPSFEYFVNRQLYYESTLACDPILYNILNMTIKLQKQNKKGFWGDIYKHA